MNQEEAKKVLAILLLADGGCIFCVKSILVEFIKEFPEFKKLTIELYKENFGIDFNKDLNKIEFKY